MTWCHIGASHSVSYLIQEMVKDLPDHFLMTNFKGQFIFVNSVKRTES